MQELLDADANPSLQDEDGRTPLHWAVANGHEPTVGRTVEGQAQTRIFRTRKGRTPLYWAARGHAAIVKQLLAVGTDPNIQGRYSQTPLHGGSKEGR